MTPEEKALELVNGMYARSSSNSMEEAKECALFAVNEIIDHSKNIAMVYDLSFISNTYFEKVRLAIKAINPNS